MFLQFLSNFEGYTLWDILLAILDIAIVWYLFYQILMLFRGTKAMQVLVGLLLFVLLYILSKPEVLDLGTVNWILEKFLASFIVIVVIIFQEDIRRGLSGFWKTGSLTTGMNEDRLDASLIEEIVKATTLLSERKIGALIAIEMDAALDQYMVEGIKVDASITKELLVALFIPYKANPTHDGAVIIRNQRINSAGCFLPLSADDHIDKALGTRHRAAIGLSESTDAVIVVVSEETGIVSIAHKETLTRKLTPEALRDFLHKKFVQTHNNDAAATSAILRQFKKWKDHK
ncbi:MAG: diadenylate cyclase CdaA [Proteobacteria bacterium]|nr:diadenylate cyclase CdaA [Pseudomonadota bacterium]